LISEEDVDKAVQNILNMVEKAQTARKTRKVEWNKEERHQKAVDIASEGIVLLKNENALPLKSGKVLVGTPNGFAPMSSGTGSAKVQTDYVTTPLWKLLKGINGDKVEYDWDGYLKTIYEKGIDNDTILVCLRGADEGEAYDRESLELNWRSIDVIRKVTSLREYGKKIVALVYAGSAIDMSEWIDDVDAVVYCGFGGEAMDEALAKVLTGEVVPSGKLAETFPLNLESTYCGSDRSDGYRSAQVYTGTFHDDSGE
jgi:beta-glucosidase